MTALLHLSVVTPEALAFEAEVEMVVIPGEEGDFGVLRDHAPLISLLRPGVLEIYRAGQAIERHFLSGGYAETQGKRCTVLADALEPVATLSREVALAALDSARVADDPRALRIAKARLAAL
jgi:F-type H+-transporting ATPase subunit epsilon